MALFASSATVSFDIQKYGALSMYPMGGKRWDPTSCVSLGVFLGMRNVTDGTPSILTHNFM